MQEEHYEQALKLATKCRMYIEAGEKEEARIQLEKVERFLDFQSLTEEQKIDWTFLLMKLSHDIAYMPEDD